MAIEVKRRERETVGSLLRRFTRRVQQSGILIRARKTRFYASQRTRRERRLSALHRERVRAERERLRKLGLLTDEPTHGHR
ncbi:30S ribosomal protein S21 [Candidatus Parcubacteria bacterium]|nr:30S ribosomal protein S21 [Candidatus Parcubacteria bacterium]